MLVGARTWLLSSSSVMPSVRRGMSRAARSLNCHKPPSSRPWMPATGIFMRGESPWLRGVGSRREFFGGSSMDTTVHEERRLVRYSSEELFDVVSAVDCYEEFLPWCEKSVVHHRSADGKEMRAELKVGFRGLSEVYTSKVTLVRPLSIDVQSVDSVLFEKLRSEWTLQSGPDEGSCWLHFRVEFKFRSPLYNSVASMFLDEVVKKMIASFEKRCASLQHRETKSIGGAGTGTSDTNAATKVALT